MNRLDRQFINWIFESAAVIAGCAVAGSYLDRMFGSGANILSLLLLFGFGLEGWSLYKIIQSASKK